jgi:hypothetical protein
MPRRLAILSHAVAAGLAAVAALAVAGPSKDDPLQSSGCRQALDALQAREADAASAAAHAGPAARPPAAPDPRLAASRRTAAIACLATRADPPTATPSAQAGAASGRPSADPAAALSLGRLARPPIAVPSLAGAAPAVRLPPARSALPAPAAPGPRFITSCDAGGCWADDGSRLDRVGPTLWGRRGACNVQGSVVTCP